MSEDDVVRSIHDDPPSIPADAQNPGATLPRKLARLLRLSARQGGAYDGERWDYAPAGYQRLAARGLVREEYPKNPAHKPRAVITAAGRQTLVAWEAAHG